LPSTFVRSLKELQFQLSETAQHYVRAREARTAKGLFHLLAE
jgi:hypothetical protein